MAQNQETGGQKVDQSGGMQPAPEQQGHFREWMHRSPGFLFPDARLWKEIKKGEKKRKTEQLHFCTVIITFFHDKYSQLTWKEKELRQLYEDHS